MSLSGFVSLAAIPLSIFSSVAIVFTSVALTTKKSRLETIAQLKSNTLGAQRFFSLSDMWASAYLRIFGERYFSKRQIFTIPLYTLIVSALFFSLWFLYLYIFQNPYHSLSARLPINVRQSIFEFYHKGVYASLALDVISIQLTKKSIRIGKSKGFGSVRFLLFFAFVLFFSYFLFSIVVLGFRVEDMVSLYMSMAPNDPMPVIPYTPIESFSSSLALFKPATIVHITTRGAFSTYFMPEPLIFYCTASAQASLVFIFLANNVANFLLFVRNLAINFTAKVGTPKANATSILALIVIALISMPIILLTLVAILAEK
ncbi:hypothetical protein [Chromobacterium haemolyticum]|uniref:hypothetical protein n=1 Tax=Chromobacterium haemolyticum TaxID=394935 RepID=UPI0012DC4024|nr:hypothetical protein [Chromobacterium haemolyticum]